MKDLIIRFLEWTAIPMEQPAMFSPFHIGITIAVLAGAFLLALFFAKKSRETRIRVLAATGWILAGMELWKQFFYYYIVNGGAYDWWYFPFQLCSVPMYLCILLPACRERGQRVLCTFMATYSLFGAVCALAYPEDMLRPYLLSTLHAFLWHGILIFISLLIIFSGMAGRTRADFLRATALFFGLAGIATAINVVGYHVGTIPGTYPDMFYITPYVATTQPVARDVAAAFGIPAANVVYLLAIVLAAWIVFSLIRLIRRA